jgi:hypothetical protein
MMMGQRTTADELAIVQIPPELLQSEPAQRALRAGVLDAKREALKGATRLERWGRPLLVVVVAVSFLHAWESVAVIRPSGVNELTLPAWIYHAAAAAFTLVVDLAALYLVAIAQTIALAGMRPRRGARNFFLGVTLLLNMAFVVRHAPSIPDSVRSTLLPILDTSFAFLLPTVIMLAIVAIESGARQLKLVQLQLLAETRMLERLAELDAVAEQEEQQAHKSARQRDESQAEAIKRDAKRPLPAPLRNLEDASLPTDPGRNAVAPAQYHCPNCGTLLTMSKYAAARRYGHCAACKPIS